MLNRKFRNRILKSCDIIESWDIPRDQFDMKRWRDKTNFTLLDIRKDDCGTVGCFGGWQLMIKNKTLRPTVEDNHPNWDTISVSSFIERVYGLSVKSTLYSYIYHAGWTFDDDTLEGALRRARRVGNEEVTEDMLTRFSRHNTRSMHLFNLAKFGE